MLWAHKVINHNLVQNGYACVIVLIVSLSTHQVHMMRALFLSDFLDQVEIRSGPWGRTCSPSLH